MSSCLSSLSWFADGRGVPACCALACGAESLSSQHVSAEVSLFWLSLGLFTLCCPDSDLVFLSSFVPQLLVFVIDTQAFANKENVLHTCFVLVLGDQGLLVGEGMPWTHSPAPLGLSWNSLNSVVNDRQKLHPTFTIILRG